MGGKRVAGYNDSFNFTTKDIALIENALRVKIHVLSTANLPTGSSDEKENHKKIMALEELLGKIHNQKIWYGQVHHTGVPLG